MKTRWPSLAFFSLLVWTVPARAEYRAFELVIRNSTTGEERVVLSTLDPNQYRTYHYIRPDEDVTYRNTWRCRGNTAYRPICPDPKREPTLVEPPPTLD